MSDGVPGVCGLCQTPIFWLRSDLGNLLCLSVPADPSGEVVIQPDGLAHVRSGELWEGRYDGARYRQHACKGKKDG